MEGNENKDPELKDPQLKVDPDLSAEERVERMRIELAQKIQDKDTLEIVLERDRDLTSLVKQLQEENKLLRSGVEENKDKFTMLEDSLSKAKELNAMLMMKLPFDSFATPKQDAPKVSPMDAFLDGLDKGGMTRKW